ncbi:MAG: bifunctional oligoribonuclease/PAP phosphatase NrnA [Anaerolineae bacterium]|jgi:phosphoesterase RecJ-like protein|nr:bifunctional oligoribonuclease/PAP phosphatase NrnA [Anaerolineae bacterium]
MTTTSIWTEANRLVHDAQRIVVVTHVAPDGDAIGTLLGVTHALRGIGKHVDAAVDGGVPDYLRYVPGSEAVIKQLAEGQWDVFISVDSSDEARTGDSGAYARANSRAVINLDHHITNTRFGDAHLVIAEAVSAAEVAFDWVTQGLNLPLTRDIAQSLLTGMVTDTLGFRTSNVKPRTLEIAQTLMAAGGSLTEITARTLDSRPYDSLLIWREAFETMQLEDGVVWVSIPYNAFERNHVDPAVELNLSEFLVKVDEAMVAASFKQEREGDIRLSLRSKPGFDVGSVAFSLGGGGHKQASGATLYGTLEEAAAQVVPLLKAAVKNGMLDIR